MNDRQLHDALRGLPRHRAADGFTERVLDRLDDDRRRRPPRWAAAAAVAALAVTLSTIGPLVLRNRSQFPSGERRAALAELRTERERLQAELDELKRLVGPPDGAVADPLEPVLYLGGDDHVEVVLDLERLADRRAAPGGGRATPASYRAGSR